VSAGGADADVVDVEVAVALDRGGARRCADAMAEQIALQRERAQFAMEADGASVEPGDVVVLDDAKWRIVEAADGGVIRYEAIRAGAPLPLMLTSMAPAAPPAAISLPEPDIVIVDAPALPGAEDDLRPIGFAFAEPWTGPVTFSAGADATDLTVRGRVSRPCALGRLTDALSPHPSGRWQDGSVWVELPGVNLESRSEGAVLNGVNAALVETEAGWELIQFTEAELVDVETYRLTRLLRGQQGSEPATSAGAAIGARILFLTGAEQRLEVADWERGLEVEWRVWRSLPDEPSAWSGEQTCEALAARMWSPAHLKAEWSGGHLGLQWIRRARKGGDSWTAGEPPHEVAESYRIRVSDGGIVRRQWDVSGPSCTYPSDDLAADFPAGGEALIEVAQLGADGESGAWAGITVEIPAS
jgi:hypothetical protein